MDIQTLLQPLGSAAPCGEDLAFSNEFDHIAEMRREDDPTLDQGEWVTSLKVADWPGVVQACTALLQQRTKDLRVANWLAEAWSMTESYVGLAQGLALHAGLAEAHWPHLHPQPDEGDQEERIGNLNWMLQRTVALASSLPLTRNRTGLGHTLAEIRQARQAHLSGHQTDTHGGPTLDLVQRVARDTPQATWDAQLAALRAAEAALADWQRVIDSHLGADGPGFVKAREALSAARDDAERLARDVGANGAAHAASAANDADSPLLSQPAHDGTDTGHQPPGAGPVRTRAQALERLREVADFFRRTEPHSPVAYLADKAVKWGDMPLHEWLRHVIKDQGAMSHLEELLGIDPPQPTDNGY